MKAPSDLAREAGAVLLKRSLPVAAREQWTVWYELTVKHPVERLRACNALGLVALTQQDYATARAYYEEACRYKDEPGVLSEDRVKILINLAHLAYTNGDAAKARDLAVKARATCADVTDGVLLGRIQLTLSAATIADRQWTEARSAALEARRSFAGARRTDLLAHALTNLGLIELEEGHLEAAEEQLLMARELHLRNLDHLGAAHDFTELGRLQFRRGRLTDALAAGSQALDILLADASLLDRAEVARLSLLFGAVNLAEKRKGPALNYLNRAAAYFAQLGYTREWDEANQLTREALALNGPARRQPELSEQERQLNYLTAVLDATDDIESVDEALRGHSERVASLALVIGRFLKFAPQRLTSLGHAARLHDVGKVAGDQHHPETGERVAHAFLLPDDCLAAIRHHHEHVDGSGEPDHLIGDDIPELARIIALADAYDHLTVGREQNLLHTQAMVVLQQQAGVTLDHRLVTAFESLHQVRKEVEV